MNHPVRRSSPGQTLSRQQGFTLFEIVITLTIIAILAAIAVPSFTSAIARTKAESVAQSIQSGLTWARSQAISSSRVVSYTPNADCSWQASAGNSGRNGTATMPYRVTCKAFNTGAIYFLPDGSVVQATNGTPPLASTLLFEVSGGGKKWDITVDKTALITETTQW